MVSKKGVEEFSINAWPSLQTVLLDGWLLRFAEGYTRRSNSINALYEGGERSLSDKIAKCEAIYAEAGQPAIFKITPFIHPQLEGLLEERGYKSIESSLVMELEDLSAVPEPSRYEIQIGHVNQEWIDRLISMNGMSEKNGRTTMKMFERPLMKTGFFTLYDGQTAIACGLGIAKDEYVGLFDIVTHPQHRGKGAGEQLLRYILKWARDCGAKKSCLMVSRDNPPANRLYEKLNYRTIYEYSYRMRTNK
ncbi:hypothetical protein PAESOLCIP111_06674 [Paenibacillus solanacearum]|uniref:N-acetyltransferase domain-containing protein n=1 Tax=Paenibacillus solanacearum TaxID=2048548 RepID=A0A916NM84_9BACL|nr:GNAT family N-acetyltransferase [Paenibacillus solanacearum]CAG7652938.1 hypothetical protein PAESOLCIP111_06674 [Paenibacillus solanacearum]